MPLDSFPRSPHLILGGARSGKSAYAEHLVSRFAPPYVYVATAQVLDAEMADRVQKHQERRRQDWETRECPLDLPDVLRSLQGKGCAVLVDCLTLWLSNLLLQQDTPSPEASIEALAAWIPLADYPLLFVSNEVGGGIVPENPLARRFRDLSGRTNQRLAALCPGVTLVVAGLPLVLK
jgi:adenosylcobinamide kinase/adenosylcobinamide-phosphate guanylyltransferase